MLKNIKCIYFDIFLRCFCTQWNYHWQHPGHCSGQGASLPSLLQKYTKNINVLQKYTNISTFCKSTQKISTFWKIHKTLSTFCKKYINICNNHKWFASHLQYFVWTLLNLFYEENWSQNWIRNLKFDSILRLSVESHRFDWQPFWFWIWNDLTEPSAR